MLQGLSLFFFISINISWLCQSVWVQRHLKTFEVCTWSREVAHVTVEHARLLRFLKLGQNKKVDTNVTILPMLQSSMDSAILLEALHFM